MSKPKGAAMVPIQWLLSRMERIIKAWDKIGMAEKHFLLRRVRDKEPQTFWFIANEDRGERHAR